MNYQGNYIYPPRPSEKITADRIDQFDNGQYLAQPKYNGDAVVIVLHKGIVSTFNRHKEPYTKNKIEMSGLWAAVPDKDASYVFTGEYLSKNKLGEDGKPFNNKLIIWDILVWNSRWLVLSTFEERADLIETIFPAKPRYEVGENGLEGMEHIFKTDIPDVYRSPCYLTGFKELYDDLIKTDLYEGVVLKRKDAKLQPGWSPENNTTWQIKVRKPTNNYHF